MCTIPASTRRRPRGTSDSWVYLLLDLWWCSWYHSFIRYNYFYDFRTSPHSTDLLISFELNIWKRIEFDLPSCLQYTKICQGTRIVSSKISVQWSHQHSSPIDLECCPWFEQPDNLCHRLHPLQWSSTALQCPLLCYLDVPNKLQRKVVQSYQAYLLNA